MHCDAMEELLKTGPALNKEFITKSYYEEGKTVAEIGKIFGLTYTNMRVIFCKLNISRTGYQSKRGARTKTKNELSFSKSITDSEKQEIARLLTTGSHLNLAKTKIDRKKVKLVAKDLELPIKHERFGHDWKEIEGVLEQSDFQSIEEASVLVGVSGFRLQRFTGVDELLKNKPSLKKDEIAEFLVKRKIDVTNNGIVKIVGKYPALHRSILEHTSEHSLSTNKITEKIWRIVNKVTSDFSVICEKCQKQVKFGMYVNAYELTTNGKLNVCTKCSNKQASMASQKLFFKILPHLTVKEDCFFNDHQGEKKIKISDIPCEFLSKWSHNKHFLRLDFCYQRVVIEYHGWQYHTKDSIRDADRKTLLEDLGYRVLYIYEEDIGTVYKDLNDVVGVCLEFLNENKQ